MKNMSTGERDCEIQTADHLFFQVHKNIVPLQYLQFK